MCSSYCHLSFEVQLGWWTLYLTDPKSSLFSWYFPLLPSLPSLEALCAGWSSPKSLELCVFCLLAFYLHLIWALPGRDKDSSWQPSSKRCCPSLLPCLQWLSHIFVTVTVSGQSANLILTTSQFSADLLGSMCTFQSLQMIRGHPRIRLSALFGHTSRPSLSLVLSGLRE